MSLHLQPGLRHRLISAPAPVGDSPTSSSRQPPAALSAPTESIIRPPTVWPMFPAIRKYRDAGRYRAAAVARYKSVPLPCRRQRRCRRHYQSRARSERKSAAAHQPVQHRHSGRNHQKFWAGSFLCRQSRCMGTGRRIRNGQPIRVLQPDLAAKPTLNMACFLTLALGLAPRPAGFAPARAITTTPIGFSYRCRLAARRRNRR